MIWKLNLTQEIHENLAILTTLPTLPTPPDVYSTTTRPESSDSKTANLKFSITQKLNPKTLAQKKKKNTQP